MTTIIMPAAFAFLIAVILGRPLIDRLEWLRLGQVIRKAGPQSHQKKAGTPTMGGVLTLFAATAGTIALAEDPLSLWPLLMALLGYGLIGMVDDVSKLAAKRSLGLKARQKLLLQIGLGAVIAFAALDRVGSGLHVPFAAVVPDLPPWLYVLVAVGTLVGTGNAVNLADGLDGLATGATAIASLTMAVMAYNLGFSDVAVFAGAVGGACLGFAWFNAHPAHVYMGDTGSLGLGGALAAMALFTRTPLLLIIVGGLFVVITMSVIIQVTYFKLTGGRRVFKMSPLHHHFELSGWSEPQVVTRFWLLALIFAATGMLALK